MAQFNFEDPRHQREQQKAAAKRGMGPSGLARVGIGAISGKHAGYQLGRQQQFEQLALSKKASELRHILNLASLRNQRRSQNLRERSIKDERQGLNWTIASGILGSGLGVLEGKRRERKGGLLYRKVCNKSCKQREDSYLHSKLCINVWFWCSNVRCP